MPPIPASERQLTLTEPLELRYLPDEGLLFEESIPSAWVDSVLRPPGSKKQPIEYKASQEAQAKLEVQPIGEVSSTPPILLRGELNATLKTDCVRCLQEVSLSTTVSVETTLHPPEAAPAPDKSAKKSEEAQTIDPGLDEDSYDGKRLDLPSLLGEALLLELDMNPACPDEEACTQRTQALLDQVNRPAQDAMEPEGIDPRWSALKNILDQTEPEDPS